ncbi:YbbR-like domain-containing protein [Psychrobacillus sp. OK032]|uniref:CdaR family protein n=1 Tax=Psychrobacillus sp. OK032 TaxID=1884358 RepID=UPI0008B35002|nr:CdaR family protein [Psychrobacillus sp. OK032]SES31522.1 YbbR domain-containing protein [Psychrobacillus sp. OK032]
MDKMMGNPWFLRIIALVLAILLFVSVKSDMEKNNMNTTSTSVEVLRDVPVEVYYDDENSVVTGVPETVTVNIEGPSQQVFSTKVMKDYKVFIDLREVTFGEHRVAFSTENFSDKLKVRIDPVNVNVVIEERVSQEFTVDLDMNESLLAENYIVKSYDMEPKKVIVTGAKSIIDSIGYVKATIVRDEGINKSFEQEASIRVLDADLNKLDVTVEPKTTQVKVNVEEYSKEVPVVLVPKGVPKEGVTVNGLSTDVKNIRLYGPRTVLDKIGQLQVDVDVSKLEDTSSFELKFAIPDGVSKLSLDKIKITADVTPASSVETEDEQEETVSIVEEKSFEKVAITVKGLPEHLVSNFETPTDGIVSVVAKGTPEALESIQLNNVSVYVNAENAEVGETTLPIQIEGPSNIEWGTSESEAKITIKEA